MLSRRVLENALCSLGLEKRSFSLAGHRTSVALEAEFWAALEDAAAAQGHTLAASLAAIDAVRPAGRSLASALRLHVLSYLKTIPPRH